MINVKSIYGNDKETEMDVPRETEEVQRSISVNFIPKREMQEVPKGAEIKSERTNVDVKQIENGYLICKTYSCEYETEGEQYGYVNNCTETFSKEKPNEATLMY